MAIVFGQVGCQRPLEELEGPPKYWLIYVSRDRDYRDALYVEPPGRYRARKARSVGDATCPPATTGACLRLETTESTGSLDRNHLQRLDALTAPGRLNAVTGSVSNTNDWSGPSVSLQIVGLRKDFPAGPVHSFVFNPQRQLSKEAAEIIDVLAGIFRSVAPK